MSQASSNKVAGDVDPNKTAEPTKSNISEP